MFDEEESYDSEDTGVGLVVGGRGHNGFVGGMALIVLAIILNFALDGMTPDDVAELPWFIALAFENGGKLGVTMVLCCLGVMVILWDVFAAATADPGPKPTPALAGLPAAVRRPSPAAMLPEPSPGAEPLAEEIPDDAPAGPKKIPALGGGFRAPGRTDLPARDSPPAGGGGGGSVELTTAKYLKKADGGTASTGPPDFRTGRTRSTTTD